MLIIIINKGIMGTRWQYCEVVWIVNFTESSITGEHTIFDKYFVDTQFWRNPPKENQIERYSIPYKEFDTEKISLIADCADACWVWLISHLWTFYNDEFPDDAEFFSVDEEEKKEIVDLFKNQLWISVKPEEITKSRFVYWG